MIAKDYRFKSWDGYIQLVMKHGNVRRTENFSLKSLTISSPVAQSRFRRIKDRSPKLNADLKLGTKFGVIVSKKISKSAVVRNRIRRRVYEWIRLNIDRIEIESLNLIWVNNEVVATMPHQDLKDQLEDIFVKAGLISPASK
jgi:ribonuclease P protein component